MLQGPFFTYDMNLKLKYLKKTIINKWSRKHKSSNSFSASCILWCSSLKNLYNRLASDVYFKLQIFSQFPYLVTEFLWKALPLFFSFWKLAAALIQIVRQHKKETQGCLTLACWCVCFHGWCSFCSVFFHLTAILMCEGADQQHRVHMNVSMLQGPESMPKITCGLPLCIAPWHPAVRWVYTHTHTHTHTHRHTQVEPRVYIHQVKRLTQLLFSQSEKNSDQTSLKQTQFGLISLQTVAALPL